MASSSHQPQPQPTAPPNPNPDPMGLPSSASKRPRSPSLDPGEPKQPRSYLQVLGKEVGTQDNKRPPKGTKMGMPKMSPIHNQLVLEKKGVETEEKEDKVENPGKGKKKVVKISPAINQAHKPVNSSKGGVPVFSELLAKLVMTSGIPMETLETGLYRVYKYLCPNAQLPSINELKQDCIRVHQTEKAQLKEILKKHRVCQ